MVSKDTIIECGICDTEIVYPTVKTSKPRKVQYFEIELMLTANGETNLNGNNYILKPNTIVLAKPGYMRFSKTHFKCYYMHYILDKSSKYYNLLMNAPNFYHMINGKRYLKFFEDLFYYLNILNMEPTSDLVQAKTIELFFFLLKDADANRQLPFFSFTKINTMQTMLSYIEEHYSDKLTLDILANISGYSKNHFATVFKEIIGVSPQKYIEQIRIDNAKKLLLQTNSTLIDIAYKCGFPSQAYFNFIFKKHVKLTPLDYRKFQSPSI
jgi:AraC-like DNA-binding protein